MEEEGGFVLNNTVVIHIHSVTDFTHSYSQSHILKSTEKDLLKWFGQDDSA